MAKIKDLDRRVENTEREGEKAEEKGKEGVVAKGEEEIK